MKDKRVYRRGDIYLVDLGSHYGSEQGGCRPVLLIQNNVGNYYGPTLIVAPITSRFAKKANQPTFCSCGSGQSHKSFDGTCRADTYHRQVEGNQILRKGFR